MEEIIVKSVELKKHIGVVAEGSSHHSGEISSTSAYTARIEFINSESDYFGLSLENCAEDFLEECSFQSDYADGIITSRYEERECGIDGEELDCFYVIEAIIISISVKRGSFTIIAEIEDEEIKQDIIKQVKKLSGGDKNGIF